MRKKYSPQFKAKVVQEILREEKSITQLASEYEVHVTQLRKWKRRALEGLPDLFRADQSKNDDLKKLEAEQERLYAEIGRLTTQLNWLKKKVLTLSRSERLAMVERESKGLPLSTQAVLLGLSRSSLYYQPRGPSEKETCIKHRIDEIYTPYPFYGSRRIYQQLRREGEIVGENTVAKYMREMGISAIYPRPNLSKRQKAAYIYPYLLRNVTPSYPNHVWGIDITYIRLQRGWIHLVAVLDWYSRYVVSWQLSDTLEMPFVVTAVDQALAQATPAIFNSDQGSHFTSPQYIDRLQAAGTRISMDGKGRAIDNILTERLWRSVKYEEVYLNEYANPRQARRGLTAYWHFYNHERLHQALDYATPAEMYFGRLLPITNNGGKESLTSANILS